MHALSCPKIHQQGGHGQVLQMKAIPKVSVVMATYNRSNLLQYSIGSLLQGSFQDWELIVVGDACTDDTADVVARFDDARIRFVNLDVNHGEQAISNNKGAELARGHYIAFLNQDDMWLPDHLARSVADLENSQADLVFGQGLDIGPDGNIRLLGAECDTPRPYHPAMLVPASLWLMRSELARAVGPWLSAWHISAPPSQEWLYRAHKTGARLLACPRLSSIVIASGKRKNSYRERHSQEHTEWFIRLNDPSFLLNIVCQAMGRSQWDERMNFRLLMRRTFAAMAHRLLSFLGAWPPYPAHLLKYGQKGKFLNELRLTRGLDRKSLPKN